MSTERVQILLHPSQRKALTTRAKQTGRSISDLVREAIDAWMGSEKETRIVRAQALKSAEQLRQRITSRGGAGTLRDAVQILDQLRDERLNDLSRG